MDERLKFYLEGQKQILQWAWAYVHGETCIDETPRESLTEQERAGLAILDAMESVI